MAGRAGLTGAGHIGLNVTNLARSIEFYREILGLEVINESAVEDRRFAFMGWNGEVVVTLWEQSEGWFGDDVPGLHHLSFQAAGAEDLARIEEKIRSRGARIFHDGVVSHGEGQASGGLFFEDPDGIRLEVFVAAGLEDRSPATPGAPSCGFF